MPQQVKAFGQILQFPDGMTDEQMAEAIRANEHVLNPNYEPPLSDRLNALAKEHLGVDGHDLVKAFTPDKSIADQAEESANAGENAAAPQVKGAPVRQSTYNRALLDPNLNGQYGGILNRIHDAAEQDTKGQANQNELDLLRTEALKPSESGFVTSALNSAGRTIKGAGQVGSDFLGADKDNAITQYGQKLLDENPTWVKELGDIKDEPFLALKEATGNSVPSLGAMVGVGALGAGITTLAPLTGPVAPVVAAVGQAVQWLGPAAVAALPSYSGIRDAQIIKNPKLEEDAKAKAIAALGAGAVGAIEVAFGPQQWALAMLTKEGRAAMARKFASTSIGEAAIKGAALGSVQEGAEELAQSPIEQLASYEDPTTDKNIENTIFSGAMGALGGSIPGGVTAAASQINQNANDRAQRINAERERLAASKLQNAQTVDEAINAANEIVDQKPVTKDDILRTADPTLADIERVTGLKPSQAIEQAANQAQPEPNAESIPSQATQGNNAANVDLSAQNLGSTPKKSNIEDIGKDTEIVLPDNTTLPAKWAVVDADKVKASIKEGVNQPRDRTRAVSDVQVNEIAKNLDYRRLSDSPVMDIGAPTLTHDGLIVGGNGRFEAIARAHDIGTAVDYVEKLKRDAAIKGINPESIDGMKKPVLVRVITQPFDTRKLAIASNSGSSLQYSGLELAKIDANRMEGIEHLDINDQGDIALTPSNIGMIRQAFGDYGSSELASLVDKNGMLSQDGVKRVRNALLAKAYGNSETLGRLIESTDTDMRNVLGALTRTAGIVANTRSHIKEGALPKELDITGNLLDAVETFAHIRAKNQPLDNFLAQGDLYGEQIDSDTQAILKFLHDNVRSQKRMVDFIRDAYDQLSRVDTTTEDIFGDNVVPTKQDVINNAKQNNAKQSGGEQQDAFGGTSQTTGQSTQQSAHPEKNPSASGKESQQHAGVKFSRSPEERLKDRERARQLERHLNENGYTFSIKTADMWSGDAQNGARTETIAAEKLARIFGRRVVWIKPEGDFGINGVVLTSLKDTIFVNTDSESPVHAVIGHELSHHMEVDTPDVYNAMVDAIRDLLKKGALNDYRAAKEIDNLSDEGVLKEIVGDIMGDSFTDPKFWQKVAEYNPSAFKRIADTVIAWLKKLVTQAKLRSLGSEQWVTDVQKAQDIIAQAVAQYTNQDGSSKSDKLKFSKKYNDVSRVNKTEVSGEVSRNVRQLAHRNMEDGGKHGSIGTNGIGNESGGGNGNSPELGRLRESVGVHFPANPSGTGAKFSRETTNEHLVPLSKRSNPIPDTITINGKERPTTNSEGKPIYPTLEGIKNFWEWFGKSRVVDDQGRPLVVYHGTEENGFSTFNTSAYQMGSHFGTIDQASGFAPGHRTGSNVIPTYLSIHNPIRLSDTGDYHPYEAAQQLHDKGILSEEELNKVTQLSDDDKEHDAITLIQSTLKFNGYDGIVYLNKREGLSKESSKKLLSIPNSELASLSDQRMKEIAPEASDSYIAFDSNQIKSAIGNNGAFSQNNNDIRFSRSDKQSSKENDTEFANEVLTELSSIDDLFRFKLSDKMTLEGVLGEVYPGTKYLGESTREDERSESGADHRFLFKSPFGKTFYVYERDNGEVFIDVSQFGTGESGQAVYAAVGNYAYNTGKVFIADPAGLTPDSLIRRTSNMLSLAIRFGTTDFMDAAPQQIAGDIKNGVTPLDWRGNSLAKTRALIHTFVTTLQNKLPRIKNAKYDFSKRQFIGKLGLPINGAEFQRIASSGVGKEARAGEATMRRGIFLQSLISSSSSERPGILEHVLNRASSLVQQGGLKALFSRSSNQSLPGTPTLNQKSAIPQNQPFSGIGATGNTTTINGKPASATQQNSIPDETKYQKAQRLFQDSFNRFRVIKEWLAEHGVHLSDKADVYAAEERYHAKVANQLEDFREKVRNPLIEKIAKAGFKMSDIADYLEAQHAPEANAQIQKVSGDPNATAYGITDKEAKDYLATAPKELGKLANELRDITEQTKQLRLSNGLINKDITDAWEATYQHYIPVKGNDEVQQGTGKGLKVNFKSKRRLGHGKRDEAVVENILMDHERAVMEVEKNRVGKHLIMMAAEIGMPDLMTIGQPERRKVLKNTTVYEVQVKGVTSAVFDSIETARMFKQLLPASNKNVTTSDITINPTQDQRIVSMASPMLADNEINVYIDGHAIRLQIKDEVLARAYGKMGIEAFGNIVAAGRILNSYLSKVYTGYNPEFILTNMVRDFSTGVINLTGEEGFQMAMKTISNYAQSFASLLKYAATNGKSSNKWIDMYRANGGNTGAAYLSDMERLGNEVGSEYAAYQGVIANLKQGDMANAARAAGRKVYNATLKWIYNLNQAGENAMRLSAFKAMIESGKSVNDAARAAKNITVNFNRKGEFGVQANAAYLFFNASVQGTAATVHALTKGKYKHQAWALASGMATIGYLAAAALAGGDEDDYDKIDDYTKERNALIKNGDGYIKIPIPYGYGFFWNLGRAMADAQRKDELGTLPWQIASSAIEELTPFGNTVVGTDHGFKSDQVLLGLLPTSALIPLQPALNKQMFNGGEIMPESPFDHSQPDREKMYRGTKGTLYDEISGWLDAAGMDTSPETLKYLTRTFTGGAGSLVDSSVSAAMLKKEGAELEASETPFIRKVYTENTIRNDRAAYYKAREEAKTAAEEFNRAKAKNDLVSMQRVIDDKKEMLALNAYSDKLSEVIKIARDQQDAVRLSKTLTVAEKRIKLKELEAQESKFYDQYLDVFKTQKIEMNKRLP